MGEIENIPGAHVALSMGLLGKPAYGRVAVRDGRLLFWTTERPGQKAARWIGRATQNEQLAARLIAGESFTLLDIAVSEAEVSFPAHQLGTLMEVKTGEFVWKLSFYDTKRWTKGSPGAAVTGVAAGGLSARAAAAPFRDLFAAD